MIKTVIRHSCGHEATHAVPEEGSSRKRREEWLRERPCQICWRVRQTEEAAAMRSNSNLPELTGNADDTAWAEVLRMKAFAHNQEYHRKLVASKGLRQDDETMWRVIVDAANQAMRELETECRAAWWIEHRFDSLNFVKTRVVAAMTPVYESRK